LRDIELGYFGNSWLIQIETNKKKRKGRKRSFLCMSYSVLWVYVTKVEGKDVNATLLYVQLNVLVCERIYSYTPVGVGAYFICAW
jgi:hypothetical protein